MKQEKTSKDENQVPKEAKRSLSSKYEENHLRGENGDVSSRSQAFEDGLA
jgi:hypothetical protein